MFGEKELERYLIHLKARLLSFHTIDCAKRDMTRLFKYLTEELKLSDIKEIKTEHIEEYIEYLYEYEKNFSNRYRAKIYSSIKAFLIYLRENNLIYGNPILLNRRFKQEKALPRNIPTDKEMKELINAIPKTAYRDRAMVEMMYGSGLRRSEIAELRLTDIDFDSGFVHVHDVKNKKERMTPFNDLTGYALKEYLEKERDFLKNESGIRIGKNQYYDKGKIKEEGDIYLFLNGVGGKMSTALVNRIIVRYRKKAGIKKEFTGHCLRHACATEMLKGGAGIRWIQKMLGHEDIKTTMIYTKVGLEELKDFVDKMHPHGFKKDE